MNNVKSRDLQDRLLRFSVSVVKEADSMKNIPESTKVQLIKSATSVGANYAEAQDSASRKDFANKVIISKKEISETRYWLKIISELQNSVQIEILSNEAHELHMILQKIITKLRSPVT